MMFCLRRAGGGRRCLLPAAAAPAVHGPQVSGHVVLPVELFMTDFARVGVPLEVGGDVVPVEVAGVGVGIVTDFTAIRVLWWSLVRAEAADADGVRTLGRTQAAGVVRIEVGKFRFDFLLHLEVHQVGRGTGGAGLGLGVHAPAGAGEGVAALVWRFRKWLDHVGQVVSLVVPEHFGLSGVVGRRTQRKVIFFLLDCLDVFGLDALPGVSAVSVWLLHGEVEDWRWLVRKVVVVGRRQDGGGGGPGGLALE